MQTETSDVVARTAGKSGASSTGSVAYVAGVGNRLPHVRDGVVDQGRCPASGNDERRRSQLRAMVRLTAPSIEPRISRAGPDSVVAFIDVTSSRSAEALARISQAVRAMPAGRISISTLLMDYPTDSSCTALGTSSRSEGDERCDVAAAIRVIRSVRGDAEAMNFLAWSFQQGAGLETSSVRERLKELGIQEEFETRREQARRAVVADREYGTRLGIRDAPVVFVDGVRIPMDRVRFALYLQMKRMIRPAAGG